MLEIYLKLHFRTKKMHWVIMWLTIKRWIFRYRYIFFYSDSIICNFLRDLLHKIYNRCLAKIWSYKRSYKINLKFQINSNSFCLQFQDFRVSNAWLKRKKGIKWLISIDKLCWNGSGLVSHSRLSFFLVKKPQP